MSTIVGTMTMSAALAKKLDADGPIPAHLRDQVYRKVDCPCIEIKDEKGHYWLWLVVPDGLPSDYKTPS